MRAIKDDELRAKSLGIDTTKGEDRRVRHLQRHRRTGGRLLRPLHRAAEPADDRLLRDGQDRGHGGDRRLRRRFVRRLAVGVPLTEPAGRGLRLTPAGHALVAQAEDVFTALARAQAAVDGLRSLPSGEVGMALFPSGPGCCWPACCGGSSSVPDVDLRCRDVDMTPPDVPALAADYDVVVTHRDERTAAAVRRGSPSCRCCASPWTSCCPPAPARPPARAAARRAGRRAVDQRGRRLAGRRRAQDARGADRDEPRGSSSGSTTSR